MTDPRIPDDLPDVEALDLDSLSEGAHASTGQWSTITATAEHRRRRRTWILSAAAAAVLVAFTAGLLISRSEKESIEVATGGMAGRAYLLPPAEATDVAGGLQSDGFSFTYTSRGRTWILQFGFLTAGAATIPGNQTAITDLSAALGGKPFSVSTLGTVYPLCSRFENVGYPPDTASGALPSVSNSTGPVIAAWLHESGAGTLTPTADPAHPIEAPCAITSAPDTTLLAELEDLRPVDHDQFDAYLASLTTDDTVGGIVVPASTTTLPEDPPANQASAEEQIAAAVAGWRAQDANGSFVNLEDGTAKAAEYAEMFATAARQSGADQAADQSGNTTMLTSVRFVTPERATITMSMGAVLPTGTFTFTQEGEAILQDGRWVVTYRTVTLTLGRACLPPGGYDGCPSS